MWGVGVATSHRTLDMSGGSSRILVAGIISSALPLPTPLKLYPLSREYLHIYISTYLAHDTRLLLLSYPRCWHRLVATPLPPPPTPTITPIVVGAVWGDATHITTGRSNAILRDARTVLLGAAKRFHLEI